MNTSFRSISQSKPGADATAPNPTELFVTSVTSCVAFYVRRFLTRHDMATDGLSVEAAFTMANRPVRIGQIDVLIDVLEGVPDEQRDRLLTVASHCTLHNTLEFPPQVSIELAAHPAVVVP